MGKGIGSKGNVKNVDYTEYNDGVYVGYRYYQTKNLQPGESETVTIDIPYKNLASFNEVDSQWQVEAGDYKVMVAKNAADLKPLTTVITEEAVVTEKVRPCLLKEVK